MTDSAPIMNQRKVSLGVVIYRPAGGLLERLQQALDGGFEVHVFDNSPDDASVRDFLRGKARGHYSTCGKNVGLGIGISAVCSQAYYAGLPALIFFDQDTIFDLSTLNFVDNFFGRHEDMSKQYSAVVFNAKEAALHTGEPEQTRDVMMAISSGTMFFLKNLHTLNWHNEAYFVDCVDYEFCLNSRQHGLKIAECPFTPGFDHLSEQPDRVYRLFGRNHPVRRYAASRIRGTLWASARLVMKALFVGQFRFALAMIRSSTIYSVFQIIARILPRAQPGHLSSR